MAPRLYVPPSQLPQGSHMLRISGQAHRHIVRVLRLSRGQSLVLFNGQGEEIEASLVRVEEEFAELALGTRRQCPTAPVHIVLVQAVAKGDRMDWLLQKTTELGVAEIWPVITSRVVVRLDAAAAMAKQARWQKIVQEAARQCGRADVPVVAEPRALGAALAALETSRRFVLWEGEKGQPLLNSLLPSESNVTLLVGPEGGLSEQEVLQATGAQFVPVTLGPRILRTETAAMVAVALVQAVTGGLA